MDDSKLICNEESIIKLLHSINRLSVADGHLEVWINDEVSTISEFISGSFTRELLELIEDHMLKHLENAK
jgi:hypothetical protein